MSEDDAWAQTLITITPENDATLRKIRDTIVVSARLSTPLDLDTDNIAYRRSLISERFVSAELAEESSRDVGNQTYLQGVPLVDISIEYNDKASQTLYMSLPCPPLKYFKDIMTSMSDGLIPVLKKSNVAWTIIGFSPETSQDKVIEQLISDVSLEEREKFISKFTEDEETEMEVLEILNFILTRSFWIVDPMSTVQAQNNHAATQTSIKFNYHTNVINLDNETQTDLTCEPKKSNTMLLVNYQDTKNLILDCLENCLLKGIESRIIVEDIIDEIMDNCAARVRFPMMDQISQTIASYRLKGIKEDDILKKLRLEVIVDPLEASIVVVPLMDDLLCLVRESISRNASNIVKNILTRILQRAMIIIIKLADIRKESQPKPLDEIFEKRRKKILESLLKQATETVSTQTGIAGVSEVTRIKEPMDVVCSVCRRQSMCHWCSANQEEKSVPPQDIKTLRTQDILLAYKPCYIVTMPSEQERNPYLHPACLTEEKPKRFLQPVRNTYEKSKKSSDTVNVLLQSEKTIKTRDSVSGWSYVIDSTFTKPWSIRGSVSDTSKITTISSEKSTLKSLCAKSIRPHSGLAVQETEALQILKNTFCTQETCTTAKCSIDEYDSPSIGSRYDISPCKNDSVINEMDLTDQLICTQQTCQVFSKQVDNEQSAYHNRCATTDNYSQLRVKSRGDGFKVIPICLVQNPDS